MGSESYHAGYEKPKAPVLTLSGHCWAKWNFMCHAAATEVGFFGVAKEGDPLHLVDLVVPKQECTSVTTELDDQAVNDHMERMFADHGITPDRSVRVWLHTHPGDCPNPSGTDERTFADAFGNADFAVMAILAKDMSTYARLRVKSGGPDSRVRVATSSKIKVEIDWADVTPLLGGTPADWAAELKANVSKRTFATYYAGTGKVIDFRDKRSDRDDWPAAGWHNPHQRVIHQPPVPQEIASLGLVAEDRRQPNRTPPPGKVYDPNWFRGFGYDSEAEALEDIGSDDAEFWMFEDK